MEEKIRIVRKFNQENRYRDGGVLNNAIDDTLNELERLQKENNDLRAIKETVRYIDYEYRAVVAVADKVCNKGGQSGGW